VSGKRSILERLAVSEMLLRNKHEGAFRVASISLARKGDNKSPQFSREETRGVAYIRNGAPLSFLGT